MTLPACSSFTEWYRESRQASYVRTRKSPGGILDLLEVVRPAGDMHRPALPELVLYQDMLGGSRVRGDAGGGYFDVMSEKGNFFLDAPNIANSMNVTASHRLRSLSFPVLHWQNVIDEAADGQTLFENLQLFKGPLQSPAIQSALRRLWAL